MQGGVTLGAHVAGAAWATLPSLVFFEAPVAFLALFREGLVLDVFPRGTPS